MKRKKKYFFKFLNSTFHLELLNFDVGCWYDFELEKFGAQCTWGISFWSVAAAVDVLFSRENE